MLKTNQRRRGSRLAWLMLHNCVAHPLMALAELAGHGVDAFHDWTAAKAYPDDDDVQAPTQNGE